jgi:hypothetical protein
MPPRPAAGGDGPSPPGGSFLRLLAGSVLLLVAVTIAIVGFARLVNVLDSGGYGTSDMRFALAVLGFSGACFAVAIATLIWDVAKRYER